MLHCAHLYFCCTLYINFCNLHNFPTEPTVERLCFYIVYMSHHIKPTSVKLYLSDICAKLKPSTLMSSLSAHQNSLTRCLLVVLNCMAPLLKGNAHSLRVTYS